MKFTTLILGAIAIVGLTTAPCAKAGDTEHQTTHKSDAYKGHYAGGRYYKFRGGWYALNYPYYWGYGPAVGNSDPYDYNGRYFPAPAHQH